MYFLKTGHCVIGCTSISRQTLKMPAHTGEGRSGCILFQEDLLRRFASLHFLVIFFLIEGCIPSNSGFVVISTF